MFFGATYKVDARSATEDVGTRHDSLTSAQPLGWPRVVERSRLRVELHVLRVYARPSCISHASDAKAKRKLTWGPMGC